MISQRQLKLRAQNDVQWSRGYRGGDRCTSFCALIYGGDGVMTSAKFIINRLAKEIYVAPNIARSERESTVDRATQIYSVDKISKLGLTYLNVAERYTWGHSQKGG